MNIRLSAASATSGLSKLQIALIAAGIVALVTGAMIPLVSLARGETHKSATGQTVSADEAKLLAKSDEQRARAAAQALKLHQQDVGQGMQFDGNGNTVGAPVDGSGGLPQNRPFDEGTGIHAVAGRLPPASKAAYPASVAIQRGIESEEPAGGGDLGGGSTRAAEREGQGAAEAEDRTERAQPMLGYSMVPGATWAARRPQAGTDGRTPAATTPPGEPGSAHADAVMERMAKAVEDSVRQTEGAKPDGERSAGSSTAAASGTGGLWTSGATGPSGAGETLYPTERRTPAEVKPQGMVPGGLGDMRIGGTVGPDQVVRQGKFLDCAVVNEIRADLVESPVIAMVARDFVTLDGKYVLIPAGSKLLGEAGRVQNLQQERVYIKFDRVLFPDQRSAYFPVRKVPAVDGMGAVGVAGDVDRHFMLQFGAAIMLGVLDGIAAAAQSPSAAANPTVRDLVTARTSANFSTVLAGVIGRYANVVPTVTVPAGSKLKVFFSEDVRLSPYMPTAELSWVGWKRRCAVSPLLLLGALLLAAGQPAVAATGGEDNPAQDVWTPQQAKKLFARIVERQPFLGSDEARAERATIDHFFHAGDYAALRGNPLMGYWSAGRFRWRGTRVAWDGITPAGNSARVITKRAWDAAFEHIVRKYGLTVDPKAAIRIRGACLGAVVNPTATEPNRGVLVEIQIDSPTGPFRYRLGMGKPTIEDAVGASLDWAVSFARALSDGETP